MSVYVVSSIHAKDETSGFNSGKLGGNRQEITQTIAGGGGPGTMVAGTTQLVIPVSDITTPGYLYAKNIHATAIIQIGVYVSTTFYPVAELKPGEENNFRWATGATLYIKSDTASTLVQINVMED